MKCKLLSGNVSIRFFLRVFFVEASVALQVLGMLHSLSLEFLAVKKQVGEEEEYTLKS